MLLNITVHAGNTPPPPPPPRSSLCISLLSFQHVLTFLHKQHISDVYINDNWLSRVWLMSQQGCIHLQRALSYMLSFVKHLFCECIEESVCNSALVIFYGILAFCSLIKYLFFSISISTMILSEQVTIL